MKKIQDIYTVVSNKKLSDRFHHLCIDAGPVVDEVKPGQFIHIRVADGMEPFFRRPFSVYRAKRDLEIFYEVVGPGTRLLSEKKKGDPLDIIGPVGTPFRMPPKKTKQVVMVAGGIGVAPFLILSDALKSKGYELILLYGGRTLGHTFNMKDFRDNGCKVYVSTDDGSKGVKGRVSTLFNTINTDAATAFIYTCGPKPMMASIQQFAKEYGIKGQAACEEVMACALGACLGCSIQTTKGYRTVCYDGPVFELEEVVF